MPLRVSGVPSLHVSSGRTGSMLVGFCLVFPALPTDSLLRFGEWRSLQGVEERTFQPKLIYRKIYRSRGPAVRQCRFAWDRGEESTQGPGTDARLLQAATLGLVSTSTLFKNSGCHTGPIPTSPKAGRVRGPLAQRHLGRGPRGLPKDQELCTFPREACGFWRAAPCTSLTTRLFDMLSALLL